jgi:2-polyprenyl-3-methyl-5-hydroxy-6-metoxy-1,4-benzoquinol methylase
MDAQERLSLTEVRQENLLTAQHLHRYELAAGLCDGLRVLDLACGAGYGSEILSARAGSVVGVDVDPGAIEEASAGITAANVEFEVADAVGYLRTDVARSFDAIVCFEALEHLDDPHEALDELARLADSGAKVIVSIPNSKGFEEENEFHKTDFGYEEAMAAFARLGEPTVVFQYLAEGSLIRTADGGDTTARVVAAERAEPEYANHFIALVGFGDAAVEDARMSLAAAPNYNSYIRTLEAANDDLYRTNRRLARGFLGVNDTAAATVIARIESNTEQAAEIERLRSRLEWPRYRAADRVAAVLRKVPGLSRLARG